MPSHSTKCKESESKELLNVAVIQTFLPIACIFPNLVALAFLPFGLDFTEVINALLLLNPVCDALAALFIVKPCRKAMAKWLEGIPKGKLTFK